MKKIVLGLMVMGVIAILISSCGDNGESKTTKSGLKYKFYETNNDGRIPVKGDIIEVNMSYQTPDTVLFDSKTMPKPLVMRLDESVFKGDLYEGIYLMHEGDSASFSCNTDSVFMKLFRQKVTPPQFDSVDYITFNIKLLSVKSQDELKKEQEAGNKAAQESEKAGLDKYLADNNITATPTETGLIFIETQKGNGEKPQKGDKVKVHYTGYLLDGTKFDSSLDRGKPFEFELGAGQVIKGWDEGLALMDVGSKATLIIPSAIAYGPRGAGGMIPPYSTLKFDVELLGIDKK
ncbi:MAG: FKBP-type peptidyl-prolyl cis-trans isomerase [Chlorobi bacterium]|nr:FKBP-type peptidyl-prolyl cis-trans isomerase [Chlorobiota bacterium]